MAGQRGSKSISPRVVTCILIYRILASLITEILHCYLPFTSTEVALR